MNELSSILANAYGEFLDKEKCKAALFAYWQLSEAEIWVFELLFHRKDLKKEYLKELKKKGPKP